LPRSARNLVRACWGGAEHLPGWGGGHWGGGRNEGAPLKCRGRRWVGGPGRSVGGADFGSCWAGDQTKKNTGGGAGLAKGKLGASPARPGVERRAIVKT